MTRILLHINNNVGGEMKRLTTITPFLVFICSHTAASSLNVSFDTFNSPSLDIVSTSSVTQDFGPVTSGYMIYESITGQNIKRSCGNCKGRMLIELNIMINLYEESRKKDM